MNTDPCKNTHTYRQCYIVIFNCSVGSLFPKSCLGNGSVLSYRAGDGKDVYKMVADVKDGKNNKLRSVLYSFLPITITEVNSQLKKKYGIAD